VHTADPDKAGGSMYLQQADPWLGYQWGRNLTQREFRERDGVFFDLGRALSGLGRNAEARLYFERVISEFPKSEYATQAKRRLDSMKTA